MHKFMKAIVRRRKAGTGSMSNGNSSNGNGNRSVYAIAQLASTGVLILGMFGLWWQSADPKARLDKIENVQLDNRKELNDIITGLRKDIAERYVSQREHSETQNRIKAAEEEEYRNHTLSLPKSEFEAWRRERDTLVKTELGRLDLIEADIKNLKNVFTTRAEHIDLQDRIKRLEENSVTRAEHSDRWSTEYKVDNDVSHRIDLLSEQIDKLRLSVSVNPTDIMTHRIDQLYESMRLIQTQVFDITHRNNNNGK